MNEAHVCQNNTFTSISRIYQQAMYVSQSINSLYKSLYLQNRINFCQMPFLMPPMTHWKLNRCFGRANHH